MKVSVLGPDGTSPTMPQLAAELSAAKPLIESGMWVDGKELAVKGGGITPTKGTIYGAPGTPLAKGDARRRCLRANLGARDRGRWSFRVA